MRDVLFEIRPWKTGTLFLLLVTPPPAFSSMCCDQASCRVRVTHGEASVPKIGGGEKMEALRPTSHEELDRANDLPRVRSWRWIFPWWN